MGTLWIVLGFALAIGLTCMATLIISSSRSGEVGATSAGDEHSIPLTREEKKALRAENREDRRLPYQHMEPDGLFFVHGKSVWTGISLPSVTDEHINERVLARVGVAQNLVIESITKLRGAATDFHLRVVGRETSPREWAARVIEKAPNPTPWFQGAIRRLADRLRGQRERKVQRVLIVRLGELDRSVARSDVATAVVTGVVESQLPDSDREHWRETARDIQTAAATALEGAVPADRDTMTWLIRKPMYGGLAVPKAPDFGLRPWGRGAFALLASMEGDNFRDCLRVKHSTAHGQERHSYTAAVVVANQPKSVELRKSRAMVRHALRFEGGADLSWRFRVLEPRQTLEKLSDNLLNLQDEAKNMARARVSPDKKMLNEIAQAKKARDDASEGEKYSITGSAQFILSAPTKKALNEKITAFTLHMASINIEVTRPRRLQYRLIEAAMPGDAPRLAVAPWSRFSDTDMFAMAMPSAGTELGDRVTYDRDGYTELGWVGRQIGYTLRDGATVCHDMHSPIARNKAAGTAIIGGAGGGKTFLGLSFFLFDTEAGRDGLAIDPKEDYASMVLYLSFGPQVNESGFAEEAEAGTLGTPGSKFQPVWPEFWNDTDIIDLARATTGLLDPFVIARTVADGVRLTKAFFDMALVSTQKEICWRHIESAIESVANEHGALVSAQMERFEISRHDAEKRVPRPCMRQVMDALEAEWHAAVAARASEGKQDDLAYAVKVITGLSRQPFSRLAFGEPGDAGMNQGIRKRRTVVTMRGFPTPPTKDVSAWGTEMRAAAAALNLVLEIGNEMLANDNRAKGLHGDEVHIPLMIPEGRALYRKANRIGRATNSTVTMTSQQADDLKRMEEEGGEGESGNQLQAVYVFRQKTDAEARSAAVLLGLDPSDPAVLASLQEPALQTGTCVMRDADGRTGTVVIEQFWRELRCATETNPDRRREAQSRPFNPDITQWTWADEPDPLAA